VRFRGPLGDDTTDDRIISLEYELDPADPTPLPVDPARGSAGGGLGERGSAEGATACRNRHIA
jgi:hypothetical protein